MVVCYPHAEKRLDPCGCQRCGDFIGHLVATSVSGLGGDFAMVWAAEFFNTALEVIVDLASPQKNHLAKIGKDVGAAAVLIAAGASVVVGLLIFGPPLWQKLALIF